MSVGVLSIDAGCRLTVWQSFFLAPNPAEDQDIAHVAYLKTAVANFKTHVASRSGHSPPFDADDQYYRRSSHLKTAVPLS
jgi:hypothetical protein